MKAMRKEGQTSEGIVVGKSRDRNLAYKQEFKDSGVLAPGVIKKFLELSKAIKPENAGQKFTDGNLEIILLKSSDEFASYFKVTMNGESYFVKNNKGRHHGGGASEIRIMNNVKQLLPELGIDWAEVVDFKMGYSDPNTGPYYVAKWDERLTKNLAWWLSDPSVSDADKKEIRQMYIQLGRVLVSNGFTDYGQGNTSYDPDTKKIILFDLLER